MLFCGDWVIQAPHQSICDRYLLRFKEFALIALSIMIALDLSDDPVYGRPNQSASLDDAILTERSVESDEDEVNLVGLSCSKRPRFGSMTVTS